MNDPRQGGHKGLSERSGWVGQWIDRYTPNDAQEFIRQRDDPLVLTALSDLNDCKLDGLLAYLKNSEPNEFSFAIRAALVDSLEGSGDDARYRLALVKHPNHEKIAPPKSKKTSTQWRFVRMLQAYHDAGGFKSKMRAIGLEAAGKAGGFKGNDNGYKRAEQILAPSVVEIWRPRSKVAGSNQIDIDNTIWLGDEEILYPIEYFDGRCAEPIERPARSRKKRGLANLKLVRANLF
jgi:hypothetical protein